MALQVEVTVEGIARRDKGGRLTLKAALYAEGADTSTAEPVFEDTASADIKGNVEGKTRQQLVNDATRSAGRMLVKSTAAYIRTEEYKSMVNTGAVKTAIEAEIGGE